MTDQTDLADDWLNKIRPHRHRLVLVKNRSAWWVRALRYGIWHSMWFGGSDFDKIDASPYPYGPCPLHEQCYYLSGVSILHRWTGFTLFFPEREKG